MGDEADRREDDQRSRIREREREQQEENNGINRREEGQHGMREDSEERDGTNGEGEREHQENMQAGKYWESMTPERAKEITDSIYEKIVAFSPNNLFEVPRGNATKKMIREMTFLIRQYTGESPIQPFALKTLAILPHLICQRTHEKSKTAEDRKAMERRLELWEKGEVQNLLKEAESLQGRARKNQGKMKEVDKSKKFASLMKQGKVSKAGRELTSEATVGTLALTEETRRQLKEKHPQAKEAAPEALFEGEYDPPDPVIFERITGEKMWKHALHTHGAAGPSGLDAKGWKSLLSSSKFGIVAKDLCDAVAALARKLATEDCHNIEAITACRLIALDKNPGCRPVGIGEVLRRIIGKAIMEVTKDDIREAVGNLQVCAGQRAGCEAAIHAMREIYENTECEAVMLVDATNAFNTLNRKATIHNIRVKCPSFAKYIENSYKEPAQLFICDRNTNRCEKITSEEGTTQGDPVAMAMYAIGLSKLQSKINYVNTEVKQVAYADDLAGAGNIKKLRKWWDLVLKHGPPQGYLPNASKSVLIVKPEHFQEATETFIHTGVRITVEGERHLGSVIGTPAFKENYVKTKVEEWVAELQKLAEIAKTEPQAAYTAFTFGIKHRWNFIMRTVPNIEHLFLPLEKTIREKLLPALAGRHYPNERDRAIIALPPRLGGLGLQNPVGQAETEHQNSKALTAKLTQLIVAQEDRGEVDMAEQMKIKTEIAKTRETKQKNDMEGIKINLREREEGENDIERSTRQRDIERRMDMAQETGASNWLTALPIRAKGFSLNRQEFNDALALRYGWPIDGLPQECQCGSPFNSNHAMTCKTGGFICSRHDEVRDITAQMLREVCQDVSVEPPLIQTNGRRFDLQSANTAEDARVDVSARGFWTRGQRAFMDVRIFNPMAQSNRDQDLLAAHKRNEQAKKREYDERIREVEQGTFTPLVFTSSGGMAPQAITFYAHLAQQLSEKKKQSKSSVVAWMRCRLSFSLLRSAILCIRGTRSKPPAYTNVGDLDFEETVIDSRIGIRM